MPYDINDGSSSVVFNDGQTPITANMLNACVIDFADQAHACAVVPAPRTVCVSEAAYDVGIGEASVDEVIDSGDALLFDGASVISTGRSLFVTTHRLVTAVPTHKTMRVARADLVAEETLPTTGLISLYGVSATDGGIVWAQRPDGLNLDALDPEDLLAPASATLAVGSVVRSVATNGAQVVTATAGANPFKGWARAGGAALWTLAAPYTSALSPTNPAIGLDGARAYLVTDEDSSGAKLRVRAVVPTTGATIWTYAPAYLYYATTTPRVASNGELVAVHISRRIVVLDARTGAELWTVLYSGGPTTIRGLGLAWGPDGRLYVGRAGGGADNGLYCYDGVTGRLVWSTTDIEPLAVEQDGAGLFVVYEDGDDVRIARIGHSAGPMLMQRVEPTARHRRPWSKLLVPVYGMR